ncbi:hypothetical protein [Actinoplanes sp. L3-i22]|uniref:hypothetical protein n=1 Tax=Actinoplanes sp. L3-i22 TaxID=2836373 RepID=UPI001C753760|nr:hypothetical protein [Actinoplanes sp. L3-i22]BCY14752.1 hypothetical protein L3i22_098400 [Actinoplanes sp. L3-i22]
MRMTLLTLLPGAGPPVAAATLRDILWAHVRPSDQVEHISARAGPDGQLEIGIYLAATGPEVAREVVERALRSSATLRRWALGNVRSGVPQI